MVQSQVVTGSKAESAALKRHRAEGASGQRPSKRSKGASVAAAPAAAPAPAGEPAFEFLFNYMGQGDCTMIRCPDDEIIIIDCGSDSGYGDTKTAELRDALRTATTNKNHRVKALIITHSDSDHCNKIRDVFGATPPVHIETTYISCLPSNDEATVSPLGAHHGSALYCGNPDNCDAIKAVFINHTNSHYLQWANNWSAPQPRSDIPDKQLVVHEAPDHRWKVSIIAGNVSTRSLDESSTDPNLRCLVTLVEIGSQKVLIGGDMTVSTEEFLLTDSQRDFIQDLTLVQVGHHGSDTSSSAAYVSFTNPKYAYISVERHEHRHYLPKNASVARWNDQQGDNEQAPSTNTVISDWGPTNRTGPFDLAAVAHTWQQWIDAPQSQVTLGSQGLPSSSALPPKYWEVRVPFQNPPSYLLREYTGIKYLSSSYLGLFRDQYNKGPYCTAEYGNMRWILNANRVEHIVSQHYGMLPITNG